MTANDWCPDCDRPDPAIHRRTLPLADAVVMGQPMPESFAANTAQLLSGDDRLPSASGGSCDRPTGELNLVGHSERC